MLDPTETIYLLVEGFKSAGTKKTFKRIRNDISQIDYTDIVSFLPKPTEEGDIVIFPFDINIQDL